MTKNISQKQTKETKSGLYLSLFVLFVAFCSILYAADPKIPNVIVTVSDFTLNYAPDGKTVSLMPSSGGSTFSGTSDSDGIVNFLRVTPGQYTLTISGIGLDPLTLQVPNSTNDLSASNLVISAWTPPSGARYAGATANLQAWSLLHPSAVRVWTNADGVIEPLDDPTTAKFHFSNYANDSSWAAEFLHDATGTAEALGTRVRLSEGTGTNTSAIAFDVANDANGGGDDAFGGVVFDGTANYGTDSRVGYYTDSGPVAGEGAGVSGTGQSSFALQYGLSGLAAPNHNSQTNIGVAGLGAMSTQQGLTSGVFIGLVGQLASDYYGSSATNLNYESAALLLDNRNTGLPLMTARTNNGTTVFSVAASGLASSVAGFKSTDTTAAVNIATTGWTNTFGKNAVVYYDGTAVTAIVKNNAGTAVYTNAAALTGMSSILLQPSGAVILSGTGVKGRATPF
ncbi:MAG: hypothetical protein DMF06_16005 [Verrucomicrobia bacterium]|nr:MAG: hypothetical protein DMF06_16005 [Verrucomicrobiota bacterium]